MNSADNFLPGINTEEIFKRTRGKVVNVAVTSGKNSAFLPRGLTVKEKAAGLAYNRAESMIKLDKA